MWRKFLVGAFPNTHWRFEIYADNATWLLGFNWAAPAMRERGRPYVYFHLGPLILGIYRDPPPPPLPPSSALW